MCPCRAHSCPPPRCAQVVGTLGPGTLSWGWVAPGSPVLAERTVWVLGVGGAYLLTPGEEAEAVQPLRSRLACVQASTSQALPSSSNRGRVTRSPSPPRWGQGAQGSPRGCQGGSGVAWDGSGQSTAELSKLSFHGAPVARCHVLPGLTEQGQHTSQTSDPVGPLGLSLLVVMVGRGLYPGSFLSLNGVGQAVLGGCPLLGSQDLG